MLLESDGMIKLNGKPLEVGRFPDGTLLIKEDFLYNRAMISWFFENNEEFIALNYIVQHLRANDVSEIHLYMPYIPNARQDRVKSKEDVFTLKYFANMLNALKFNSVKVLDPHSAVSEALIENIVIESPSKYINMVIDGITYDIADSNKGNDLSIFYPDEGSMKRYSGMISSPYAFGIKMRDWTTGEIMAFEAAGYVKGVENNDVLIVDDICSRGGTFYHSAKKLKELGAKNIYLYVTHCENTILDGELLTSGLIERVYTTNSIFTKEHEKINVIHL